MNDENIKKNSIYNSIKSCLQVLFPLITFPYISRVLQVDGVGKVNFTASFISYFIMLASLGVTTYAIRECAKVKNDKCKLETTASEIFSINVISTIISYALLFVCTLLIPTLHDYWLLLLIQSFTMLFTLLGADWLNTALEDFRYLTIRYIVFQLLALVFMFIGVRNTKDYYIYAMISVFAGSGAGLVNIWYRKKFCTIHFIKRKDIFRHLVPILTLFSMMFAQQILAASDNVIIGFVYGDYEVGLYSVAMRISTMVNSVIASVTWVVMPQLSKAFADKNRNVVVKILDYGINFMATCGVPCVVGMYIMAPEIIELVAGAAYMEAFTVLRLLTVSMAISYIGNVVFNMCLLASGKDKVCASNCIITTILNVILNLIFIPIFGIEAAAMTTVFSQGCGLFLAIPHVEKWAIDKKYCKTIIGPFVGGIAIAIYTYLTKQYIDNYFWRLAVAISGSVLLYAIVMIISKNEIVLSVINNITKKQRDRSM